MGWWYLVVNMSRNTHYDLVVRFIGVRKIFFLASDEKRHMLCVCVCVFLGRRLYLLGLIFYVSACVSTSLSHSLNLCECEIAYYIDYFPFRLIRIRLFFPLSFNFPLLLSSYCLLCSSFRFNWIFLYAIPNFEYLNHLNQFCFFYFFCWFSLGFQHSFGNTDFIEFLMIRSQTFSVPFLAPFFLSLYHLLYIYMYKCVCVCVHIAECMWKQQFQVFSRSFEKQLNFILFEISFVRIVFSFLVRFIRLVLMLDADISVASSRTPLK